MVILKKFLFVCVFVLSLLGFLRSLENEAVADDSSITALDMICSSILRLGTDSDKERRPVSVFRLGQKVMLHFIDSKMVLVGANGSCSSIEVDDKDLSLVQSTSLSSDEKSMLKILAQCKNLQSMRAGAKAQSTPGGTPARIAQ